MIPNATQARNTIESGDFLKDNEYLKSIEEKIQRAISQGLFMIQGAGHLSNGVVQYMKDKGYVVYHRELGFEKYHTIHW